MLREFANGNHLSFQDVTLDILPITIIAHLR